jgi:hypothetical protein
LPIGVAFSQEVVQIEEATEEYLKWLNEDEHNTVKEALRYFKSVDET